MRDDYDLVVVGGGAAGLSGAIAVARFGRPVLVLDAGHPRNAPADGVHNLLGHDGIPPLELVARGRDELATYGGEVEVATVVAARAVPGERIGFGVELSDGRSVRARRVLVTSGVTDVLPEVEGLAERWGRDLLHCPFCHGWEVRGRRIGILATHPMATHAAKLWSQLGEVTVFLHDGPWVADEDRVVLDALGVNVVDGPVERVVVQDDRMVGVATPGGEIGIDALVAAPLSDARSGVLESLGVPVKPFEMAGHVMGWVAEADVHGGTPVAGVAVAGNVVDIAAQVSQSMAGGTRAGAMMLMSIIEEDAAAAVLQQGEREVRA